MKVTKITIGRLFNLGSYEHVRYEVEVSVGELDRASEALIAVERILAAIKPKDPLESSCSWHNIKVKHDHWTEQDWWKYEGKDKWEQAKSENEKEYDKLMALHKAWVEQQASVRAMLDNLGAASRYKDCKLDWEDEP